ncbi:EamA family transporter [Actinomyces sp. MRS3W]|uniref:EamA family transporter n=1 Tax=Actinomyces sp. MRS3W TaxID=2800796 RepID=UPI0028FDB9F3|nr:EamA family transporter [Actinomyces sp. MRS3W]MDU0347640.1 EamA family transporter [Actinomyces sp. MRS3W]
MWIALACGSALFAGLTSVLAKQGVRTTDSTLATALRTPVILIGAWAVAWLSGSVHELGHVSARSIVFLILSGLATGASWLCFFRALQLGQVSKVVPVDKTSTVLTVLLAVLVLGERPTPVGWLGLLGIAVGTVLMLDADDVRALVRPGKSQGASEDGRPGSGAWLVYALGSAFFAALTAILGKIGITDVPSDLGTAVRTGVILVMAWGMVAVRARATRTAAGGGGENLRAPGGPLGIVPGELGWILASAVATCASWLCYFAALQGGPASAVVPIDKLSVLVTVAFSALVQGERPGCRAVAGLVLLTAGTVLVAVV